MIMIINNLENLNKIVIYIRLSISRKSDIEIEFLEIESREVDNIIFMILKWD